MRRAKKVLVADDYELARDVLCRILNDRGFKTEQARNGCEAFAKAVVDRPDLIPLDVNMPGMDGYTTLERMKRHPRTYKIPVMILSGLDWSYERGLALELGADDYLPKPVMVDELYEKVESALRKKRKKTISPPAPCYGVQ
jgi:DNA-binding response OmpR family regulator